MAKHSFHLVDHLYLGTFDIQLKYKQKTDVVRLFSFSLERAHETEFFIRKAIGWSLRQYAWTNKKAVKDFVEKNKDSFSPLTVREALKNC